MNYKNKHLKIKYGKIHILFLNYTKKELNHTSISNTLLVPSEISHSDKEGIYIYIYIFLKIFHQLGRIDLVFMMSQTNVVMLVVIVVLACSAKVWSSFLVCKAFGISARDAIPLGVLMNTKGLLALIVIGIGRDVQVYVVDNFINLTMYVYLIYMFDLFLTNHFMTLMQALDNVTYPAMVIVFVVMTSL